MNVVGKLISDKEKALALKVFKELDKDADNKISRKELFDAFNKALNNPAKSQEAVNKVLKALSCEDIEFPGIFFTTINRFYDGFVR